MLEELYKLYRIIKSKYFTKKVEKKEGFIPIKNPTTSSVFTNHYAYDCSLTGSIDTSGMTTVSNPNLDDHLHKEVDNDGVVTYRYKCPITGTLKEEITQTQ